MMAFFLCAAIAIFGIVKVFKKENFKSLVIAVLAGMIISAAPMVLAYASGIPLQGSLNWGMNVMNGTDTKEGRTQQAQSIASENMRKHRLRMRVRARAVKVFNRNQASKAVNL